jgi:DNA repair protein RadA
LTTLTLEDIPNVGAATAKHLRDRGFYTVESVAVAPSLELAEASGISQERAKKLSADARSILQYRFQTAKELMDHRENVTPISTGCQSLDELLRGGIETQGVLELIGEYGVGKTQICHAACVMVQLPLELGGLSGNAIYIDTEGTFRPERVAEIAEARGLDAAKILPNVLVARAYNSDHQMAIVEGLDEFVQEKNIRLIIVDSVISHFRSEYLGRESLAKRQQNLNKHLHRLLRISESYDVASIVTNQAIASPDGFYGPASKPAGGHILAHFSTTRLWLRRGRKYTRIARVIDSSVLPAGEALFTISDLGVTNVDE